MPQTKTAAPVLQHRDGQTKKFITCILPHISPICKAFANFTLTACGLGALCAVAALAQGGGAAAMAGLAACLLGGWAALKVHYRTGCPRQHCERHYIHIILFAISVKVGQLKHWIYSSCFFLARRSRITLTISRSTALSSSESSLYSP